MPGFIVNPDSAEAWEIELKQGANLLGRAAANDFQIDHPSVADMHCQVTVTNGGVTLKDLGSTGTRIDGRDLYLTLPVAPWEAALGATIAIALPAGHQVKVRIPAGVDTGTRLRSSGNGEAGTLDGGPGELREDFDHLTLQRVEMLLRVVRSE